MREVFEYTQFWAVGSGREFALGAMHAQYGRLRTAEASPRSGIEAGTTFDKNSALPLTIYTLAAAHEPVPSGSICERRPGGDRAAASTSIRSRR